MKSKPPPPPFFSVPFVPTVFRIVCLIHKGVDSHLPTLLQEMRGSDKSGRLCVFRNVLRIAVVTQVFQIPSVLVLYFFSLH